MEYENVAYAGVVDTQAESMRVTLARRRGQVSHPRTQGHPEVPLTPEAIDHIPSMHAGAPSCGSGLRS
jgi:hypothetical protein